jgi:thioredoxin 1
VATALNQDSFADFVSQAEKPVLVDFFRDGCVPCRRVAPLVSKAETQYEDGLLVARVNMDQNKALAEELKIEAAPTLILFRGGQEVARHRGVIDREGLKTLVENEIGGQS